MKKIFIILLFPILLFSLSINPYSSTFLSKKSEYINELNLFKWEQMSFFLYNKLYANSFSDYRLSSTFKIINEKKLSNYLKFKSLFDKNDLKYETPLINNEDFLFFDKNINKVYHILIKAESPKEIFKIMCISQNSLVYKYSSIPLSDIAYANMLIKELHLRNRELLSFIDKSSYLFGFNGCCSLANILCKTTK